MPPPPYRRLVLTTALAVATSLQAQEAQQHAAIRPPVPTRQARAADDAYLLGVRQLTHNDPAAAERSFAQALALDPGKPEYALSLAIAKEHHVSALVQQAAKERLTGNNAEADRLFAQARALDPDNLIVTQHLDHGAPAPDTPAASTASDEIAKLGGPIHLAPNPGQHSFHSRGDIQGVVREVYSAYGIKTSFDTSVTNQNIRFDLEDADFATATRVLLDMTHLFAVPLLPGSALFAHDNQENRDRLMPQVEETFYLPGLSTEQLNELSNVAKNIFDLKQVAVAATNDRIVIRGNEDAVNLVNVTFAEMIDSGAEIMLKVHIYELDKTHMRKIGADLPSSAGIFSIAAQAQQLVSSNTSLIQQAIASGILVLNGKTPLDNLLKELAFLAGAGAINITQYTNLLGTFGGGLTFAGLYLGSGSSFNLLLNSSDARLLDDVQMRVSDNKEGTFRTGTRYPITTSTYSSSVSSSLASALSGVKINGTSAASLLAQFAGSATSTVPQIQYEDLGLTLKATPIALKSGQVHVHLDLKIEALGAGSLNGIPVLNNRQLVSDITIPTGATAMLASEVSNLEQHAIDGLPGISEIPGFQGTDRMVEKDTGELLITITPSLVRKRSPIIASRRLLANVSVPEQ